MKRPSLNAHQLAARLLRGARARIRPQRSSLPDHTIAVLAGVITVAAARRRRRAAGIAGIAAGMLGLALVMVLGLKRTSSLPAMADREATPATQQRFIAEGNALASVTAASGEVQPLLTGQEWHSGDRLRSDALHVALTGADGTTIEVGPRSELQLVRVDVERWFRLARGAVSAHVTKLKAGEQLVVADARCRDRGARHPLSGDGGPARRRGYGEGVVARVVVSEGVVVVRSLGHEVRVEAGHHWPIWLRRSGLASAVGPVPERVHGLGETRPGAYDAGDRASPAEKVSPSTLAWRTTSSATALKAGESRRSPGRPSSCSTFSSRTAGIAR